MMENITNDRAARTLEVRDACERGSVIW